VKTSARGLLAALAASVLISGPALANSTESRAEISKVVRVNGTIVDVAASNPAFSKLVTALTAANLVGVLQGPGPFTVYAPTDAARERNTLFINNSRVIGSPILTDNGVIYVVDSVLLPQYR
jgi:uncharacterized surface protein with fasciclin (FAS1) repeats